MTNEGDKFHDHPNDTMTPTYSELLKEAREGNHERVVYADEELIFIDDPAPYTDDNHWMQVENIIKSRIDEYWADCAQSDVRPSLLHFALWIIHDQGMRDGAGKILQERG